MTIQLEKDEKFRIDSLLIEWISFCLPPIGADGSPATGFGVVLKDKAPETEGVKKNSLYFALN